MDLLAQNRTYHEAQSYMALLPAYFRWTYGRFGRCITGKVVELGCGAGLGIPVYADRAEVVYAVDHNPELLRRLADVAPNVEPITADLLEDWHELSGIEADTVILMDVLEHFRDDETFLRNAAKLLKPSGRLIIKVPAQSRLYGQVDRASGHFRRYDSADIHRVAQAAGLEVETLTAINRIGGLAYRRKRGKSSNFSSTFSPSQLRLINVAIPLVRAIDAVMPGPGLSLIGILKWA